MRIVLEGPDCSGKTTLAMSLMELLPNHFYLHNSLDNGKYVWRNSCGEVVKYCDDIFYAHIDSLRLHKHVIVDRLWPSELIYGTTFRNKTEYVINDMRAHLNIYQPSYIGCLPPKQNVLKKFEERKNTEDFSEVEIVYDKYQSLFQENPEFLIYNYTQQTAEEFIREILID